MQTYRPTRLFNLAFELMTPTTKKVNGSVVKEWIKPADGWPIIYGSYVTFGGSDRVINGVTVTADTGSIETWYDPRITADCRLRNINTNALHEILGQPENIEGRNQYCKLQAQAVKGGA